MADTKKKALAVRKAADLTTMTSAEKRMLEYTTNLDTWLSTPFIQPSALAEVGVPFDIIRAGTRQADSINDPNVKIDQFVYLCILREGFDYLDKAKELHEFQDGDQFILALTKNNIRGDVHNFIVGLLEDEGIIPNQACRLIAPSKAGNSPAVSICAASAWQAL